MSVDWRIGWGGCYLDMEAGGKERSGAEGLFMVDTVCVLVVFATIVQINVFYD